MGSPVFDSAKPATKAAEIESYNAVAALTAHFAMQFTNSWKRRVTTNANEHA